MVYRREIDGLRAIALLPVVFFHAGFEAMSGGYVGVDVFFVISGYLIASLIVEEQRTGVFSLTNFYARRIRRIIPALTFVILACLPFAWLWMLPEQIERLSRSIQAVAIFASNFYFDGGSGYFAPAAELQPLLHTWSLAVEEQFYLLFPLFMLAVWRLGRPRVAVVIMLISLVSLALAQFGGNLTIAPPFVERNLSWLAQPAFATFYWPIGRIWELGLGILLALAPRHPYAGKRIGDLFAMIGLACIAFSAFAFDESTPFPSAYTLVPTLGTAAVIVFASAEGSIGRALALPPIAGLGLLSYSAYLWHQPLFAFARLRSLNEPPPSVFLALMVIALMLAYVTWRWIERPFRQKHAFTRSQLFAGAVAATGAMVAVGLVGRAANGFPARLPAESRALLAYGDLVGLQELCTGSLEPSVAPEHSCVVGAATEPTFAIIGDSHAAALAPAFATVGARRDVSAKLLSFPSCPPMPGLERARLRKRDSCPDYYEAVYEYLADQEVIRHVVLSARWTLYLEGTPYAASEGGVERASPSPMVPTETAGEISEAERRAAVGRRYAEGVLKLLEMGKTVVIVYPVPEIGWDVPEYLAQAVWFGREVRRPLSVAYSEFERRNAAASAAFDALGEHIALRRVKPADIFCNRVLAERCVAELDGAPIYFDDDHLHTNGAVLVIEQIFESIDAVKPESDGARAAPAIEATL